MVEGVERRCVAQRLVALALQLAARVDALQFSDESHDAGAGEHQSDDALEEDVGRQRGEVALRQPDVGAVLGGRVAGVGQRSQPQPHQQLVITTAHHCNTHSDPSVAIHRTRRIARSSRQPRTP